MNHTFPSPIIIRSGLAAEGCIGGVGTLPAVMPTYEYACKDCGHSFEIVQSMKDDALTVCPECGGSLRKVFAPPAIAFKGSGFYATDHREKAKAPAGETTEGAKAEPAGATKGGTKGETKAKPKEGASPSSTSGSKESTSS